MNLSLDHSKITFDDRDGTWASVESAFVSRLAKMPAASNDNRDHWGGHWFLEAGFGHDEDVSGVLSLADWQYLKVRIALR